MPITALYNANIHHRNEKHENKNNKEKEPPLFIYKKLFDVAY